MSCTPDSPAVLAIQLTPPTLLAPGLLAASTAATVAGLVTGPVAANEAVVAVRNRTALLAAAGLHKSAASAAPPVAGPMVPPFLVQVGAVAAHEAVVAVRNRIAAAGLHKSAPPVAGLMVPPFPVLVGAVAAPAPTMPPLVADMAAPALMPAPIALAVAAPALVPVAPAPIALAVAAGMTAPALPAAQAPTAPALAAEIAATLPATLPLPVPFAHVERFPSLKLDNSAKVARQPPMFR